MTRKAPRDLGELLAAPGVTEQLRPGSRVGLMAYHGGNLEVGTDQVAEAVADATGASLYAVRQPEGMRWHVPSARFRPEHSPTLAEFFAGVDLVVTVHGFGRRHMLRSILLGGRNRDAASVVGAALRRRLPHYEVVDDLDAIPPELRGVHRRNPVNVPDQHGVQIELPPRVRGNGPFWNVWRGGFPTPHTELLIDGLTDAVTQLSGWVGQGASRSRTQEPPSFR